VPLLRHPSAAAAAAAAAVPAPAFAAAAFAALPGLASCLTLALAAAGQRPRLLLRRLSQLRPRM
jgi:hypothetical protein